MMQKKDKNTSMKKDAGMMGYKKGGMVKGKYAAKPAAKKKGKK